MIINMRYKKNVKKEKTTDERMKIYQRLYQKIQKIIILNINIWYKII